jgi:hypothetical protein
VHARWFDPTNGAYRPVEGEPLQGKTSAELTAPGKNGDGDRDWVLVLGNA